MYLAWDTKKGELVAIKEFFQGAVFEREKAMYELVRGVSTNVMTILDSYKSNGRSYIVLPYMEGGDLYDAVIKKSIAKEQKFAILLTIVVALSELFDKDILHRDIKLDNVLMGEDGPVVSDFGHSAVMDENRKTKCNGNVGTPIYLAPEIETGDALLYDVRADIYSFGVLCMAVLYGHNCVVKFRDKWRVKFRKGWSDEVYDFVCKMVSVNPDARPQSWEEVIEGLKSLQ